MSKGRQVHPDLMSTPSINLQFQQAEFPEDGVELAANLVVGNGCPSAHSTGGHPSTSNSVAADAGLNRPVILLQPSMHEGNVGLLRAPLRKFESQLAVGLVILGHHDEPAGVFVQAMH